MSTPPPESTPPPPEGSLPNLVCSFCGKTQKEVRKLIAGPSVYICNECIELCNDIIHEDGEPQKARRPGLALHRRDALLDEIRRAVESAFPDRAEELIREMEQILPLGFPFVCVECSNAGRTPNPIPADYICPDFQPETWQAQGYQTDTAVRSVAGSWLQILRKGNEYVILAPLLVRKPIRLTPA